MKALGIDASLTGTGVVILDDQGNYESTTIKPQSTDIKRLLEIEEEISLWLNKKPDIVCIEGYAFSKTNRAHQIGELGGVLRRLLYLSGIRYVIVPPAKVKQFATGKGNARKEIVLLAVYKRWGIEFSTSDEADAYVLARLGLTVNGHTDNLIKSQVEIAQKIN